ncbi:MAG TPA: SUMF1/EgtB/PvdO family nonheme iron enzyme [Kiritimatiellia bacterium]|nr:SUMF1/EgtB/PvdO family nonheme iron enzyme [Kiritimatiellia bacterium]
MKKTLLSVSVILATIAVYAAASINSVIVRQQWPWNNKVHIDFVLTDPDSLSHDVSLVLRNDGVEIPFTRSEIAGEFENLAPGLHRFVWDPSGVEFTLTDKLTATIEITDDPKKYLILDLTDGYSAEGQIPYSWTSRVPGGGWFPSANYTYRNNKIVFRRIKAGSFLMGSPETEEGRSAQCERQRQITLTKDYYMAIIPLTGNQAMRIYNSVEEGTPGNNTHAFVSYGYMRGKGSITNWPAIGEDSFCGVLNTRTAFRATELPGYRFDLPTAAQWEYACRAGTTTAHPNGTEVNLQIDPAPGSRGSATYDPGLEDIAVYLYNRCLANGTWPDYYPILKPNNWGLHMMLGSGWELIREGIAWNFNNWGTGAIESVDGEGTVSYRSEYFWGRGGSHASEAGSCRSASWCAIATNMDGRGEYYGGHIDAVRLCLTYVGE